MNMCTLRLYPKGNIFNILLLKYYFFPDSYTTCYFRHIKYSFLHNFFFQHGYQDYILQLTDLAVNLILVQCTVRSYLNSGITPYTPPLTVI